MLVAALGCSSDTVDALVGFLGGKTLQGNLDCFALFLVEIVVSSTNPSVLCSRFARLPRFRNQLGLPN